MTTTCQSNYGHPLEPLYYWACAMQSLGRLRDLRWPWLWVVVKGFLCAGRIRPIWTHLNHTSLWFTLAAQCTIRANVIPMSATTNKQANKQSNKLMIQLTKNKYGKPPTLFVVNFSAVIDNMDTYLRYYDIWCDVLWYSWKYLYDIHNIGLYVCVGAGACVCVCRWVCVCVCTFAHACMQGFLLLLSHAQARSRGGGGGQGPPVNQLSLGRAWCNYRGLMLIFDK